MTDKTKRERVIEILMRKLDWTPLDIPDEVRFYQSGPAKGMADLEAISHAYVMSGLDEYLDWARRNPEAAAAARSGDDAFLAWYDANPELAAKAFPPRKVA